MLRPSAKSSSVTTVQQARERPEVSGPDEPLGVRVGVGRASDEEKVRYVRRMFGAIAPRYDLTNTVISLGLHRWWKRLAARLAAVPPGGRAADVCCGTGDLALLMARRAAGEGARRGLQRGDAGCGAAPGGPGGGGGRVPVRLGRRPGTGGPRRRARRRNRRVWDPERPPARWGPARAAPGVASGRPGGDPGVQPPPEPGGQEALRPLFLYPDALAGTRGVPPRRRVPVPADLDPVLAGSGVLRPADGSGRVHGGPLRQPVDGHRRHSHRNPVRRSGATEGGAMSDQEKTGVFRVGDRRLRDVGEALKYVYEALLERGYNPIDQIVGYLVSGDPTYITSYKDARTLIRQIDR